MGQKTKELEIGGISFGLTSGVITTLGVIAGLASATDGSKLAIIAAILTIAIADSLSDAFGITLSEESRLDEKSKPVWIIALFTFLGKFVFSLLFVLPLLILSVENSIFLSMIFGFTLIIVLAIFIAKRNKRPVFKQVFGNFSLSVLIVVASYLIGKIAERIS
jgi:VIT1/CCC1 family predicted Fe2+/Mn2+ transporter